MKHLRMLLAVVLLAGIAPHPATAADLVTINAILPLTGAAAFSGGEDKEAIVLFEGMVNKAGGVRGRPVRFQIADDQSSPQVAVQLANGIIDKHASVIVGPGVTGTCAAVEALVRTAGPIEYCLSPGLQAQKGTFAFSASRSLDATLLAEARYMSDKGYDRIGVLTATDASGQAGSHALHDALPSYKALSIVDEEQFQPTAISLNAEVSKVMQAKPQAIWILATGPAFATALRALKDAGVDLPTFTSSANLSKDQLAQYTAFLPKDLYFDGFPFQVGQAMGSAGQRNAYAAFTATYKAAGVTPTTSSGYTWDTLNIIFAALKQIGPDATAAQIREFIANLHGYSGVNGTYDFRPGDQHGLTSESVVVVKWSPPTGAVVAASGPGGKPL